MIPQWVKDSLKALILFVFYSLGKKDEKDSIENETNKKINEENNSVIEAREKVREKYRRIRDSLSDGVPPGKS